MFSGEVPYADAAANGLLVSGSEGDAFGNVLKTQVTESQADVETMRANTAMNVWSREEAARSNLFSARQSRSAAEDSLFSAREYRRQGRSAYRAGITSALGTYLSGGASTGASAYSMFGRK